MRLLALALACLMILSQPRPVSAQRGQDSAREAVESGKFRPLREVLAQVKRQYRGRVIDVQLVDAVYRIKLLGRGGRVRIILVDARTARVIGVDGG